jgi:hypothetical protein
VQGDRGGGNHGLVTASGKPGANRDRACCAGAYNKRAHESLELLGHVDHGAVEVERQSLDDPRILCVVSHGGHAGRS